MTTKDVYEQLREHLDDLPVGFPKTESGVEIRILKRLFTEEEAEMATHLTYIPETVEEIAQRANRDPKKVKPVLDQLADKGLIFRSHKRGITQYRAEWFAVGFYEHQVNNMTKELAEDFEQYMEEALRDELIASADPPQLRVIPVVASLSPSMSVLPHEDAREIIKKQNKIAVAPCICKREKEVLGEKCDKPEEVCMVFSTGAYYYIENGYGREITVDEALKILDQSHEAGLVCSPSNDQKGFVICNCCGCHCGILTNLKKLPKPATLVPSNYFAVVDEDSCTGCQTCLDRCQMDAITFEDDIAQIDLDYCIGCGLCISTCPSEALSLKRKDESEVAIPPSNAFELYREIGEKRLQRKNSFSS
ncbi:MAG: 4Fe-4S binding protein [Candidatus Hermodarchaeota archaeon]|nr:4Fe-4S binding protein [Candidatus Hermodarchaeota archaeon]